jgi:hypothetical protein
MTENLLGWRIMNRQILKLLPLLPLYLALIIVLAPDTFEVAESYYYGYAVHMLQDFGSPPSTLWWGPGYSLVLIPFAALDAPILAARLMNAFFLFGALIYFYATLSLYVEERYALLFTYVLGLYPPFLREIHQLRTENLVYLLICGLVFHFCKLFRGSEKKTFHLVVASLYLAFLALTKIFFGYVILTGLVLSLLLFAWRRQDPQKKTALFYGLSLIWCIPYLLVTYSWTGKVFYWATSGGMSLYWMASPYAGELGSWFSDDDVQALPELSPHREFFAEIVDLSEVERDEVLKSQALETIIHHPSRYLTNWIANVGRLLFSYPFSYTPQKISTYFYLLPNMFLVVFLLVSVYPAVLRRRAIPYEIYALLLFALIALGGTSLLCGYDRQFRPLVPILLLWLSYVYVRILRIELRDTGIGHAMGESGLGDAS